MIRLPDPERIGTAIHDLRVLNQLRQCDLAEALGCGQGQISEWESAATAPTSRTLIRLANALGYDLALIPREDT